MSRVGTNLNKSSDLLEARMLPNVEQAKAGDGGGEIDLAGDGVHKIYLHRAQLEMYNWQARTTYCRAARGFGKTSFIGVHMMKCVLGLPRQMGGFCGASAKQLYCRTMPNALKVIDQLGFVYIEQNRTREAIDCFKEASGIFSKMGDLYNDVCSHKGLYESYWSLIPDSETFSYSLPIF